MRSEYWIALLAALALIAFQVGHARGLRSCPAWAEEEARQQKAIERDVAWAMSQPTGREDACERAFNIIADEIANDVFLEQEDRAAGTGSAWE